MPSPNESVEPTPFEPVQIAPDANKDTEQSTKKWIFPSLLALFIIALVVVFWLPDFVDSREARKKEAAIDNTNSASADSAGRSSPIPGAKPQENQAARQAEQSPWADAQQARLRLEAQNILADLLELQFALEDDQVGLWGQEAFAAAGVAAEKGDAVFRERDYEKAIEHYQESHSTLQNLKEARPEILKGLLTSTEDSIQAGDTEKALESLEVAAAIDPLQPELSSLHQRIKTLPGVLSLLSQARQSEEEGELETASGLLAESAALDPLHQTTITELDRVTASLREQKFQKAMSSGYLALAAGNLNDALKEFNIAQAIDRASAEAANAIIEVENARTTSSLAALQKEGLAHEQKEQWSRAVQTYKQALGMDASLTYAREGLERSSAREKLDKQFQSTVADPDRLANAKIAQDAQDFLEQLRATRPQGELLRSQINDLDKLLLRARTPVTINLLSDEQRQHNLDLKPGIYTAVGTRAGFRDVRKEIAVRPENEAGAITIICTERI
jgi:tetratricopeptide (TPR) repeat protein